MFEKCKKAHHVLILNLLNFKKLIGEAENFYKFCLKWLVATHKFKDEIGQIESQLVKMGKNYKVLTYVYGKERDKACELHNQLALRKSQRDEFIRMF